MVKYFMFGSATAPSPSSPPDFSSLCALSVSAFSSLPSFRSGVALARRLCIRGGGSSDPCSSPIRCELPVTPRPSTVNVPLLSPLPATLTSTLPRRCETPPVSPLFATLTDHSQLNENPATLSPFAATLTSRVKHNSFVCHSYKKHPGVGYTPPLASRGFDFPASPSRAKLAFGVPEGASERGICFFFSSSRRGLFMSSSPHFTSSHFHRPRNT